MLAAGTTLGPYRILALLGAGGMGEVYRARDARLGRDVALKVISAELARDPAALRRFEQEARAAGALNHANVCAVLDFGDHEGAPFVVMELLEGESLRARLDAGPVPARKAIDWIAQAAHGLAAAHEKGIVHRDLMPENLFLTSDGRVKVLDFGLAKLRGDGVAGPPADATESLSLTRPGAVLGTAGYMAPEQVRGEAVDHRADLFALGAILYELLTGQRAFPGAAFYEVSYRIAHEEPPAIGASGRRVPPALEPIVRRCLEKNRQERYQNARDLAFGLETAISGTERGDVPAVGRVAAPATGRRSALLVGAAAVLVGVAAAAGYLARQPAPAPQVAYERLTFRRGTVGAARFAPDGQTVVFDARWNGNPSEIFTLRIGNPESRPLGVKDCRLLAVSGQGELAVQLRPRSSFSLMRGSLARVSLGGGEPRILQEDVYFAEWAADGSQLAIVREDSLMWRLQLSAGPTLAQVPGRLLLPRAVSDGSAMAFVCQPTDSSRGVLALAGPDLPVKTLCPLDGRCSGLAWHPRARELWYSELDSSGSTCLRAVATGGRRRLLVRLPGVAALQGIAADGGVLLSMTASRLVLMALEPGQERERDLSWFDDSRCSDLSPDGRLLLFHEKGGVYLRPTGGSPAVRLGEGGAGALSPDRQWVAVATAAGPPRIRVIPVGAGRARDVPLGDLVPIGGVQWYFPDGQSLLFAGSRGGDTWQFYAVPLGGGPPRLLPSEGCAVWLGERPLSPDGRFVVLRRGTEALVVPTEGGSPSPVPGIAPDEAVMGWTADSRGLYVLRRSEVPARVFRLDIASGRRELWRSLGPADPAGVESIRSAVIAPDGRSYAYNFAQAQTDLYLVTGLE